MRLIAPDKLNQRAEEPGSAPRKRVPAPALLRPGHAHRSRGARTPPTPPRDPSARARARCRPRRCERGHPRGPEGGAVGASAKAAEMALRGSSANPFSAIKWHPHLNR
ncbi:anaphase-promoting complex subunit 16 isoform X3 [Elephas maximus indicus]|nr:anaphase-promoting complex subunit 16 isoform X3 [Elephas maximus indicus]